MGLEALTQELKKKTESEVRRIDSEAKAEAKKIKEEAKREVKRRVELAEKEAGEFVERDRMRIPAARLKAKRISQDAKYGLVETSLKELKKLLQKKANSRREYEKLLERLIKGGISDVGTDKIVISVRKGDMQFAKKFGKVNQIDCNGGAIISSEDGRVRINNTFESLLEKRREELEQAAFEYMFGKG